MRISRPCYDKMHRCPGWSGGGIHSAKVTRCEGGYISYYTTTPGSHQVKRLWKWRLNRCPKCGVVVLPYAVRYLDWGWYRWQQDRAVRAVATLYFHVPPVWLGDWLGEHLPGFTDSYEDVYDDWKRKQNRKERASGIEADEGR